MPNNMTPSRTASSGFRDLALPLMALLLAGLMGAITDASRQIPHLAEDALWLGPPSPPRIRVMGLPVGPQAFPRHEDAMRFAGELRQAEEDIRRAAEDARRTAEDARREAQRTREEVRRSLREIGQSLRHAVLGNPAAC